MPSPNTVPQPEFFFHQFSVDLNTAAESPVQQNVASITTGGDNADPSGYLTFASIDAFGASSRISSTMAAQNDNYNAENAPTTIGVAEVSNLDGHFGFENSNPTSLRAHAHPDSVSVMVNQADPAFPSQIQPFDANIYNELWPSTSNGAGYTQSSPTQSATLPSENYRSHGTDRPIAPNGHHLSQASAVVPFEQHRRLGPAALVVIPGAPAFSIPIDVANVLLTVYQRQ